MPLLHPVSASLFSSWFLMGLLVSVAPARPWVTVRVFLSVVSAGVGTFLASMGGLIVSLIAALISLYKTLDCALLRHLVILAAVAFFGRDTPFGGWAVLLLAAVMPWGPHAARSAERSSRDAEPPVDEAAFEASLRTVTAEALRQQAKAFQARLNEPTLTPRQRQAVRRQRAICYRVLAERRAQPGFQRKP